jgi:hypothetical protein
MKYSADVKCFVPVKTSQTKPVDAAILRPIAASTG